MTLRPDFGNGRYELEYVLNVADTYGLYVSIFDSAAGRSSRTCTQPTLN